MTTKTIKPPRRMRHAIVIAASVGLLGIAAGAGSADAGLGTSVPITTRCSGHSFTHYRACAW
jgi:hypothetical protein